MNRQMYNMGGPSLQAGAPDITLTGDMRPTYSAMRKQRMAFGGIAGLDGRKKYGIGSWFQENIMDPIKDNPITSAVIGGGLVNQFGLPDSITEYLNMGSDVGQNFLGDLISKVPGSPVGIDTVFGDTGEFTKGASGTDLSSYLKSLVGLGNAGVNPGTSDDGYIIGGGFGGGKEGMGFETILNSAGQNITTADYLKQQIAEQAKKAINPNYVPNAQAGGTEAERLAQYKRRNLNADLVKALGIGTAAGAYVDSQPKDVLPTDTTGINFQTAQQVLDDPNQRFKPPVEATQLAAEGGRIGYNGGGVTSYKNLLEKKGYKDMMQGMNDDEIRSLYDSVMGTFSLRRANGGRIGYANGTPDPVIPENFLNDVDKIIEAYMKSQEGMFFLKDEINKGKSMGQIIDQMKKELEQQNPSSMGDMDPGFTIPGPPQSPNATPIPEGMMINPRKTMEFRDVNQNGIPDRDEGIYSKDRDFVPKKDFPNMDPGFTIPRVTRAEGGLMDLGGMEKDYREDGGFVPIGGKEKADDVPARLSKNEFVFTADAVRNAGGGDIDQGAQVMEKLMRNLESGGQVSEESQGLEGAREMFETSQRLEKRII